MHENEWKELEIGNLPSDILVGNYEFIFKPYGCGDKYIPVDIRESLQGILTGFEYLYRKRQPKAPTHEDIMTKWWKGSTQYKGVNQSMWFKVMFYFSEKKTPYGTCCIGSDNVTGEIVFTDKSWFIGRESSDIPQKETK